MYTKYNYKYTSTIEILLLYHTLIQVYENKYERPYQKNEPESLQNIILKGYFYNIKSMYPEKLIRTILLKISRKNFSLCSWMWIWGNF